MDNLKPKSALLRFARKRIDLSLQRRFSDRGDAILVMAIILIPFFFLAAGFAMDLTKATYVKQQFQTMAQESTTEAARNINQIGAIKPEGVYDVIDTYNQKYKGQRGERVKDKGQSGETMEGTAGGHGVCDKVDTPDGKKTAPYMKISLDGGRNNDNISSVMWSSEAGSKPVLDNPSSGEYDSNLTYYSIKVTVYDSSPNIMLGMFGRPCQALTSKVSAISFGSNEDIEDPNAEDRPSWVPNYYANYEKCVVDDLKSKTVKVSWSNNPLNGTRIVSFFDDGGNKLAKGLNQSDASGDNGDLKFDSNGSFSTIPPSAIGITLEKKGGNRTLVYCDISMNRLPPPTGLHATKILSDVVHFKWNPVPGAATYRIQMSKSPDMSNPISFRAFEWTSNTAFAWALEKDTKYYVRVVAVTEDDVVGRWSTPPYPSVTTLNFDFNAPTGLKSTKERMHSLDLAWNEVPGASMYRVQVSTNPSMSNPKSENFNTNKGTVSGLNPETKYYFRVMVTNGSNSELSPWSEGNPYPSATTPEWDNSEITNFRSTSESGTTITLAWDSVNFVNYYVRMSTSPTMSNASGHAFSLNHGTITGLNKNTKYYFTVEAMDVNDHYQKSPRTSPPLVVKTTSGKPNPPSNFRAVEINMDEILFRYNAVPNAGGYLIMVSKTASMATVDTYFYTSTAALVKNLTPATTYYFKIAAIKPNSSHFDTMSDFSSPALKITTPKWDFSTPTGLTAIGIGKNSLTLGWDHVLGAEKYRIQLATSSDMKTATSYHTFNTNHGTITGLTTGKRYYFRVTVTDGTGKARSLYTPTPYPSAIPTGVVSGVVRDGWPTETEVTYKWKPYYGAVSYRVYIKPNRDMPSACEPNCEIIIPADPTNPSYSFSTLPDGSKVKYGTNYYAKVSAINSSGTTISSWQDDGALATTPVGNIKAKTTSSSSINVTWNKVPGAVRYRIYYMKTSNMPSACAPNCEEVVPVNMSSPSWDLTGLDSGETYYIMVSSIMASGKTMNTWPSTKASATTTQTYPNPPANLRVTDKTMSSLSLKWDGLPPASMYRVQLATNSAMSNPTYYTFNKTSGTIAGLTPGVEYYYRVVATDETGERLSPYTYDPYPSEILPLYDFETPQDFELTGETKDSVYLSWSEVDDASGKYKVQISEDEEMSNPTYRTFTGTEVNITGLTPGSEYFFRVAVVNNSGVQESEYSPDPVHTVLPLFNIDAPDGLVSTGQTMNSISFKWDAVTDADYYTIELSENSDMEEATAYTFTGTTATVTGLDPATEYYFRIAVSNAAGDKYSEWSDNEPYPSAETPEWNLSAPSGLTNTAKTMDTISLKWNAVPGDTGKYKVQVFDNDDYENPKYYPFSTTTGKITGLDGGKTYHIGVAVVDSSGEPISNYTDDEYLDVTTPLWDFDAPDGFATTGKTMNSVALKWNAVSGAPKYKVVATPTSGPALEKTMTTITTNFTGLDREKTYIFSVMVIDNNNIQRSASSVITVTTPKWDYATPTGLVATGKKTKNVELKWNAVSGATKYNVQVSKSSSMTNPTDHTFTGTTGNVTGLNKDTSYYFHVSVVNAANSQISEYSSVINVKTLLYDYEPPANLRVTDKTMDTLSLAWNGISGISQYRIKLSKYSSMSSPEYYTFNGTTGTISDLMPGARYYYQVAATDTSGENLSPYTDAPYPNTLLPTWTFDPVTGLKLTGTSEKSLTMSWDETPGSSGIYRIQLSKNSSMTSSTYYTFSGTSGTIGGLTPGQKYYFRVTATDGTGKARSLYTPTPYPSATPGRVVYGLNAGNPSETKATLNWVAYTGAVKYRIYYSATRSMPGGCSPECTEIVTPDDPLNPSHTFTHFPSPNGPALKTNTNYYMKVSAIDSTGKTITGWQDSPELMTTPIGGMTAKTASSSSVNMKWNKVSGAGSYRIYFSKDPAMSGGCSPECTTVVTPTNMSNPSWRVTGLDSGTKYYFKVSAIHSTTGKTMNTWPTNPVTATTS